jgi:hydrogenase-4 component E
MIRMILDIQTTLTLCAGLVFLLAILMNLVRKNTTLISLYLAQSLAVAFALTTLAGSEHAVGLFSAAVLTLIVKVAMAPAFLFRLIKKFSAHFSAASYLPVPLTLIALALITGFAYVISSSLTGLHHSAIPVLFAAIFSAFFLMINRRGALSVVVGVLALENGVVLQAAMLGAAHTFALEFTIAFDIAVWIAIAYAFLAMLHREFGVADADTRLMAHLTEE